MARLEIKSVLCGDVAAVDLCLHPLSRLLNNKSFVSREVSRYGKCRELMTTFSNYI